MSKQHTIKATIAVGTFGAAIIMDIVEAETNLSFIEQAKEYGNWCEDLFHEGATLPTEKGMYIFTGYTNDDGDSCQHHGDFELQESISDSNTSAFGDGWYDGFLEAKKLNEDEHFYLDEIKEDEVRDMSEHAESKHAELKAKAA